MNLYMRHIAVFLLAVFLIPAGYQAVHVLQHHSDIPCSHQCNTRHHAGATAHRHNSGHPFSPAGDQDVYNNTNQDRRHCPIVDFRFSVKDLPQLALLLSSPVSTEILPGCQLTRHYIEAFYSQQNPRAPPRSLTS